MSTNQKIYGLQRALIEKAMQACFEAGHGITHDELRALLNEPFPVEPFAQGVLVSRELIERISSRLNETGQFLLSEELHAAVAESAPITGGEVDRLNGMLDAASELIRTKERVNRALRSALERIKAINDNNFNLVLDRLFDDPAAQEQGEPVAHGTNSDKYKAELYDEVWQKSRSLGFGNVTDALASLEKRGEPVAITDDMNRLMDAYTKGEFGLEGGPETVEAMSVASFDAVESHGHDADSYMSGYCAAMYEQAKPFVWLALLPKVEKLAPELLTQDAIDRIVPSLNPEPDRDDFHCEWALWSDRERIRGKLSKLLTANPAPVAVVLPECLTAAELEELEVIEAFIHGQGLSNLAGTMAAARQFIDEVTRLNPSLQPLPLQSQPL